MPDHGKVFTPHTDGSEAKDLAPKDLDSYKRGYAERATYRLRDTWELDSSRQVGGISTQRSNAKVMQFVENICSGQGYGHGPNLRRNIFQELDLMKDEMPSAFSSGKCVTTIISQLARRRNIEAAMEVWRWMDHAKIERSAFHYNALISACEKCRDWRMALDVLKQMEDQGIQKNEITFSSAISACEKSGNYQIAIDLLDQMERECEAKSVIPYNAAISACEKGLNSAKALQVFDRMRNRGVEPTVVTYSALISACEKCGQWKLALDVLEGMKKDFGTNVIAYSAAIAAVSKGQQWEIALKLFRELQASGANPSVVTYNTTMTALEKGLQWEKALDLFDEMKRKNLPITVVSYGSAISACEKGYQWKQCLDYLDEMTERGIEKNVIIFGAAMSCMEKCRRADIAFQLMERMQLEGVKPNVHIYNCAITACARCRLPEKGYEIFMKMEREGVKRDVVTYNAVLDAVCTNVPLARSIFHEGVKIGYYAKVSRLGEHWLELDLHFLSLGGGEIAMWWWFEECLVPYLVNSTKLEKVKAINIVTGYGKTRKREARKGDDGMRKRVLAMMHFMNLTEVQQNNMGRVKLDIDKFVQEVRKNGGKILFDSQGYRRYVDEETRSNEYVEVEQVRRPKVAVLAPTPAPARPVEQSDNNAGASNYSEKPPQSNIRYKGSKKARGQGRDKASGGGGKKPQSDDYYGPSSARKRERSPDQFISNPRTSGRGYQDVEGDGYYGPPTKFRGSRPNVGESTSNRGSSSLHWEDPPVQPFENSNRNSNLQWEDPPRPKTNLRWEAPANQQPEHTQQGNQFTHNSSRGYNI